MKTLEQLQSEGEDWRELFRLEEAWRLAPTLGYRGTLGSYAPTDVAGVIAETAGDPDGADWLAILLLQDRRYVLVSGGCCYTGWDCQSSARACVADSLDDLLLWGLSEYDSERLGFETRRYDLQKENPSQEDQ